VDLLIVGAFIEARSCERFALVAPHLESDLGSFYLGLLAAESRHFRIYLELAKRHAENIPLKDLERRVDYFREKENQLICSPDLEVRFHSGVPQ
jgi:tRNA-(ms[2]io[6]A)-hydroxylase